MSVQMTIRVDDELAAFVDETATAADASRAEVINRLIRNEIRRRRAADDARSYAGEADPDLESDAYAAWATQNARRVSSSLD